MTGPYFLGIDLGTGSAKGVVTDIDGNVIAQAVRPSRVSSPQLGYAEMDAERDWWEVVVAIAQDLTSQVDANEIGGVAVSGLGPALVMLDADDNPLRPAILYGIDRRAQAQIAAFEAELGAEQILDRCGSDLSSQALGPKLAWIRDEEPDVWARTARWCSSHSFVVARLTGEWVLDHHTASQCDPFYDIDAQDWARDWVDQLLPGLPLPRLFWPHQVVGAVTTAAALETGLRPGTPVVAGTIDAWAEAVSAGVRRPGDLMLMYGSTMFLVQVLPAPAAASGLWTTSGVVPGSHTIAAGMSTSGSLASWTHDTVGAPDYSELLREAGDVPPGSRGIIALPYFAGERSPIYDPQARGALIGLTLEHSKADIFRAVHEGIAFGLRQILSALDDVTGPPARIVAVGGGTRGAVWPQIVSDVTQRRQEIPAVTVGASYGDALLAAIGTGAVPVDTDWARASAIIEPNTDSSDVYDELYEIFRALYPTLKDDMHRLAAVQKQGGPAPVERITPAPPMILTAR